jgi:hypothetical protein
MTLTLNDNRVFSVTFRHNDKPVDARPLIDYRALENSDYYVLILRLMEV